MNFSCIRSVHVVYNYLDTGEDDQFCGVVFNIGTLQPLSPICAIYPLQPANPNGFGEGCR